MKKYLFGLIFLFAGCVSHHPASPISGDGHINSASAYADAIDAKSVVIRKWLSQQ